jgi:uncharacterized protein YkwD
MFASLALAVSLMAATTDSAKSNKPQVQAASDLHPIEKALIERTNRERQRFGLRPLRLDFGLLRSARRHAAWMTRTRNLQHTSAMVAENIALGQRSSNEAVQSWMNSPGHRANMLNASYTRVGAAAYTASSGQVYWCIQFLR